ncbi:sigma-54-dependent Fis family transcriptional regulator [Gimesia panareensis]|uniref:sigma-54-dependent Fis family transcriptional regulator n=1 Tax=Gimesia panareensis TaxID=2527978 RepID=UPI0011899F65|nr:sigma 54-interacting transcriptional regulator [Gimesia panareensis]QDU52325.1 Formate hydrogenlyase transcriptional activator [Gimesia panareensis]
MDDHITMNKHTLPHARAEYNRLTEQLLEQLNMGLGFEELFNSVYDQLHGIVPYNRIAVALLEEPTKLLRLTSCRSDGDISLKVGYAAHLKGSTLAPLLETGQPRIIDDLDEYLSNKRKSPSTELILREGMKSSLTLPLLSDGKPIGVIFFSSRKKYIYTLEHATLLRQLAGHIAISIEKARRLHELQQKNRELAEANRAKDEFLDLLKSEVEKQTNQLRASEQRYRLLAQINQIINSSLDVRKVFEYAANEIHKLLSCDRVSLLLNRSRETSRHGFAIEFLSEGYRSVDIPIRATSGSAFDWVMEHRIPRVVRSLEDSQAFPEDTLLYNLGYRSNIYLPLLSRERSAGVLGVASRQIEQPDCWDQELLNEISGQLAIALDNAAAYGEIDRLKADLEQQNVYLRDEIRVDRAFGDIIGNSRAMQQVRVAIEQVAQSDSNVLIVGETGTGKELIARAIHDHSRRSEKLLVKVNCAALAPGVIASELFGHETGAFTGATDRRTGRFELAHGGSIFLDEISEIPFETQVMLLRVLQERTIERVGGNDPIKVDARVIVATNRDLKTHVEQNNFREDLYYRLNVFPIRVPPLRERREDIPALLNHFIERFSLRMNKSVTRVERRTMDLLTDYHWPGNVRELENITERSMIISQGDTLKVEGAWLSGDSDLNTKQSFDGKQSLANHERRLILDALARSGGKVYGPDGAAAALKVKPTTLYGKMRKHNIKGSRHHSSSD